MSPFTTKDWQDGPSTATPITAAALENLETRVTDYTDDEIAAFLAGQIGRVLTLSTPILLASATYVSDAYEALPDWFYDQNVSASVTGTSQAGTLALETSVDEGATWVAADSEATVAGAASVTAPTGALWRIKFTNGATAQTATVPITVTVTMDLPT